MTHTRHDDTSGEQKPVDPFKALRARSRPIELEHFAIAWMAHLPREVQPRELGRLYPRVVNKLAQYWLNGSQIDDYLNELIVDNRGRRIGFPAVVRDELVVLRSHNLGKYVVNQEGSLGNERISR